jgi:hypothetical protein
MAAMDRSTGDEGAARPGRPNRLALLGALGGLLPMLIAIVPFVLGLWAAGLAVYVGGNLVVIAARLAGRKAIASLDLLALALGVLLAAAYVGFGNHFFLQHFGVVINGVLLGQVALGELRGTPWTEPFAKRMYPPEAVTTRAFVEGNRLLSRMWGIIFVADILMSALGTSAFVLYVLPNVLLVLALALGPSIAQRYGRRFLPTPRPQRGG